MAIVLQRPDSARARPSTLLKKDEDYQQLFSSGYPIELYLVVAKLIKRVQAYLRSLTDLQQKDKTNLTFYVAMYLVAILASKPVPEIKDIVAIDYDGLQEEKLALSLVGEEIIRGLGATDQVAKGLYFLLPSRNHLRTLC
jgi:Uri superfamily endonuclease